MFLKKILNTHASSFSQSISRSHIFTVFSAHVHGDISHSRHTVVTIDQYFTF